MSNIFCPTHGCLSASEEVRMRCDECHAVGQETLLYPYPSAPFPPAIEFLLKGTTAMQQPPEPITIDTNTGRKDDSKKPAFELIPPHIQLEVAKVLEFGARKYGPENWKKVPGAKRRYIGAAERHINAHRRGELLDPETGYHHLSHAIASLMFLGEFFAAGIEEVPE